MLTRFAQFARAVLFDAEHGPETEWLGMTAIAALVVAVVWIIAQ